MRSRVRALLLAGMAAAMAAGALPVQAMSYSFADFDTGQCQLACLSVIVATGDIMGNEDEELAWFLRHAGRGKLVGRLVMIHSPGGNMAGGMRLGAFLRQNKASVMVAQVSGSAVTQSDGLAGGLCGSACVLVLAGGVQRIVPPGSVVAVHGAAQVQTHVHDHMAGTVRPLQVNRSEVAAVMGQYYRRMGVSAHLATLSESVPQTQVRVLTAPEMTRMRLARTRF